MKVNKTTNILSILFRANKHILTFYRIIDEAIKKFKVPQLWPTISDLNEPLIMLFV